VDFTNRGGSASVNQQGVIEEAQVAVEALCPGVDFDGQLEGTWRLLYTSAPDVTGLVARPPDLPFNLPLPFTVGDVFQRFSSPGEGVVENIIKLGFPFALEPENGATFTVRAEYRLATPKRIELLFREAELGSLHLSPLAQGLLAPALLPRGTAQMKLLQGLRGARLTVPLRTPSSLVGGLARRRDTDDASGRPVRTAGGEYLITYLDGDMLIGRSVGSRGSFIFERAAAHGECE